MVEIVHTLIEANLRLFMELIIFIEIFPVIRETFEIGMQIFENLRSCCMELILRYKSLTNIILTNSSD